MRNSRRSSNDCALQHPPTDARRVGQPNRPQETPSGRFRPTSPELPREIQGIRNIRGRRHPDCNRRTSKGRTFGRFSLCCRSGKRDSHSRCARAVREYWQTPPAPGRGVLRSHVPGPSCTGIQKKEGRTFWILPSCFGAENGTRTRDLNLGKVALYQLSYFRITLQTFRFVNLSLFIREVLFTPPRMFVNLATSRSRCLYRIASAKICQKNYSPKLL